MRAMVMSSPRKALELKELPQPTPSGNELLIRVQACGVCRTDLHVVDGDLLHPNLPLIPGHEIVGTVVETGDRIDEFKPGDRVGVPWLGKTCGACSFCLSGRENLCDLAAFTGYQIQGGYAEYTLADARYCFRIPEGYPDIEAAPLLCAGLIGYRSLRMAGPSTRLGLYGFGAAAHIVIQIARFQNIEVYAFTSPGDLEAQQFARSLGAVWAGDSDRLPPEPLDAAILFAPVGSLVPAALRSIRKGGTVVCAGIHMSDIPTFPYAILWGERSLCSVANLTRQDGKEFFRVAPQVPVKTTVKPYPLEFANEALSDLRAGRLTGAAVLVP
ncbi:MAG: zinc-dependent alcohol dehydrogenase family protein [Gammaproteobacteria bacterium]